jgi:hypothetical protein
MPAPDCEVPSDATPGEWKALLAPMLAIADSAEEVHSYLVIAVSTRALVELRTNIPDGALRELLLMVMPEPAGAWTEDGKAGHG